MTFEQMVEANFPDQVEALQQCEDLWLKLQERSGTWDVIAGDSDDRQVLILARNEAFKLCMDARAALGQAIVSTYIAMRDKRDAIQVVDLVNRA